MTIRAKFRVDAITHREGWVRPEGWQEGDPVPPSKTVKLSAVYDDGIPENARFSEATPSGEIEMLVNNPLAAARFELGQAFYVDFTLVAE